MKIKKIRITLKSIYTVTYNNKKLVHYLELVRARLIDNPVVRVSINVKQKLTEGFKGVD